MTKREKKYHRVKRNLKHLGYSSFTTANDESWNLKPGAPNWAIMMPTGGHSVPEVQEEQGSPITWYTSDKPIHLEGKTYYEIVMNKNKHIILSEAKT